MTDWRTNPRKKRSVVWRVPEDELRTLVAQSDSISTVLRGLGLRPAGGNAKTLKTRLDEIGIDYRHMPQGRNANRFIPRGGKTLYTDSDLFTANSLVPRRTIRQRILKKNLLPYICAICGSPSEWRGQPLPLILDHINGIENDHRLENLRFVCPNCNAQLPTYCGRKNRRKPAI